MLLQIIGLSKRQGTAGIRYRLSMGSCVVLILEAGVKDLPDRKTAMDNICAQVFV